MEAEQNKKDKYAHLDSSHSFGQWKHLDHKHWLYYHIVGNFRYELIFTLFAWQETFTRIKTTKCAVCIVLVTVHAIIVFCVGASKAPPVLYFAIQHRKAVPLFLAIPFMHLRIQ